MNCKNATSLQAWILAPDIGQCPAKNRVISDEGGFTADTVVRCEVKKNYKLPMPENSEAFGNHRPLLLWFFLWTF